LHQVRDLVDRESRCWVTVPGVRAETLRADGERVYTLTPFDQRNLDVRNVRHSFGLTRHLRPRVVVTSGAGVVLTFTAASRVLGAKVMFAETMARVRSPSMTGRIVDHFAAARVVQWPDLVSSYRNPRICRPTLLPDVVPEPAVGRAGTFISLGTHPQPFTRLLRMIDDAAERGLLPRPIVAQLGDAHLGTPGIKLTPWLSRAEFQERLASAELVIGHCGAGFLGAAVSVGQRPLVLPRLSGLSEHVDDHQVQLFDKLAELGLIVALRDQIRASDVEQAITGQRTRRLFADVPELRDVLADELGRLGT
jgi:UDP-N-acetylglucosamine transferase subunit ALG13